MKLELQRHQLKDQTIKRRKAMYGEDRVYKKVEVIGTSKKSIEDAIQTAVTRAHTSLEKLSWFEVGEVRGHVGEDGTVSEYQVVLKVAFQLKK
jgi:flavin-binding protein dodecin